jgi:F-type H+-transporting ATPase subunit delta
MSELATLARPYAAAVFKSAKQNAGMESWSKNLAFMSAVINNGDMAAVIDNPKVSKQQLTAILLDICQGQIDSENENFLKLLVHNGRLKLLPTIVALFEAFKAEDEGYVDVDVNVAYEFSESTWGNFVETLEKKLNKKARITVTLDKSLIGGVLVRAGDKVIDGSVKGQLQHMRKTL